MKREGREIQVVVDGQARGMIYLKEGISFKIMARGACSLRGVRKELRARGVAGWGFDGANFYVTTRRKRHKSFAPNFQWIISAHGHEPPKMDLGPNPFTDLL